MKNIFTGIAMLMIFYPFSSYSQINFNQPGLTIKQITDTMQAALASSDTLEGGGSDQLKFFNTFWSARVYKNDSSSTNMFQQYLTGLDSAITARITGGSCSSGTFAGNWQVFGPDSLPGQQRIGKINAIWADPTDSNHILAGATGGLFETTNGGVTWQCLTDKTPIVGGIIGISSIAVNPLNNNTIFLGTSMNDELGNVDGNVFGNWYYGAGILKSYDGGNTWSQETPNTFVERVYFTPDSLRIYACALNGLYTRYNSDTGSWYSITPPAAAADGNYRLTDVQFVPGDPAHFFVTGINSASNVGIFESMVAVPASADWDTVSSLLPTTFAPISGYIGFSIFVPNADTLYAMGMRGDSYSALFKYNISGVTHSWSQWGICSGEDNPYLKLNLIISPNNPQNIYFGTDVPYVSVNYGNYFHRIGEYRSNNCHADVRSMWLQTSSASTYASDILVIGTDGGVGIKYSGTDVIALADTDNTFTNINGIGLSCGEFWNIGMSWDGKLMVGGMQHDGIVSYEQAQSTPWVDIYDITDASTAAFNNKLSIGIVKEGDFFQVKADTSTGRLLGATHDEGLPDVNLTYTQPFYIDTAGNQFVGMHDLWELTQGSSTWSPMGATYGLPDTGQMYIRDFAFSAYDTSVMSYLN